MINSTENLSSEIINVLDEFTEGRTPIDVKILFKGEPINYYSIVDNIFSTETILRVLQVLVVRGKLNPNDIKIIELYIDEDENRVTHEIAILPNGMLSELPNSCLYSLTGELHLEVTRYNRQLEPKIKFNFDELESK